MPEWRRALLKRIGAPVTQKNLPFLATWQRWEGGHTNNDAQYNWLNTTQGDGPSINSVGVKKFRSFDYGIKQTAATLNNGYYDDILQALASGDPYKANPSRGLQTWVAGPNGSKPEYAAKVLGMTLEEVGAPPAVTERPRRADRNSPSAPIVTDEPGLSESTIRSIFGGDPFWAEHFAKAAEARKPKATRAKRGTPGSALPQVEESKGTERVKLLKGKGLVVGPDFAGTSHAGNTTSGLGWGESRPADIMAPPGTPVRLKEAVTIVYWHPDGAQEGGDSVLVRTASGREYWLGHIDNVGFKPGDKVKAGQIIAAVSGKHPRPHLHIDTRG
jgi:murein DD-endopeptidase MepM/ murein hydrolase activator NlpD